MKFKPGSKMSIHCYKHNGKIHRTWDEVIILDETNDYIVCANNKINITESDGRSHRTRDLAIIFLYKKRWFHITAQYKKIGLYYKADIASPIIVDENIFKYIDYDLDLKVFPDGEYKVLDRNEYKFHRKIMKYSEDLDYWIENHCEMNLKYNTIQTYKILIEKYLKPNLGHYRLGAITSVRLTTFINEIVKQNNFSRAYFRNILKVVKGSFRDACSVFGFINNNPAMTVRLPKIEEKREDVKHVYTQDEIDRILLRFKDDDTFTCAFLTSCYTGMRTSEVFALTWEDIDFDNRIIRVEHSIYDKNKDYKGRWYIGSTKTINGVRNINICNTLFNALVSYKKKQDKLKKIYGTKYYYYHIEKVLNEYGKVKEYRIVENDLDMNYSNNINLIFTKKDGKYCGSDITKYPYSIIHHELGIEKCRFYDLRGSYATKTLKSGVEIRDVADILGHKNVETTENYYISSSHDSRKEATDIFEKTTQSSVISSISKYDIEL